jgi:hypothetical protein
MHYDLDKFDELMGQVEAKSSFVPKKPNNESVLDLADYNMDPVHEGILQKGINRMSNLLSANIKSKISNEWKHLDEDERKLLLRIVAGNSSAFENEGKGIDVALAQAFKDSTLTPTKSEDGTASIIVNKDVDVSNSGAETFPQVSIEQITGNLKCNYASFKSFVGFPVSVKSIEFAKGKSQIENLKGLPEVTGRNDANYAVDLKYTKINTLKGWRSSKAIKGHVSFRGCGLKDIAVDSPIYISGSLDIRDNPNISIESLKSIVLKDYSKNQIVVKGQIYHTLEEDGYYSSKKMKPEEYVPEDLGALTEATSNKQGKAVSQEELWKIGPEIIKQAEERKLKKEKGSAKDTLAQKIKPEVQSLVSDMASSQLDRNTVAQANQKLTSGMTSDEFRKLMKGLFDNLLKQLNDMMRNTNGGDSSQVEKSIDTITKVTAENIADKMELFAKTVEDMVKSGDCLDIGKLNNDVSEILKTVSPIGSEDVRVLQQRLENLATIQDRTEYSSTLKDFLDLLYVGILGKPAVSDKVINEITTACLGDVSGENLPEIKGSPEITSEEPSTQTPPETPAEVPVTSQAPAPTVAPTKPTAPAKKPAMPAKKPASVVSNPTTNEPKKATTPSNNPTSAYSDKEKSGLDRFSRLISTSKSSNSENSEDK